MQDDGTVKVDFTSGQFVNQSKLYNLMMVPEHIWKASRTRRRTRTTSPIGTGPFTLTSWTPQAATLDPNPNYWGGKSAGPPAALLVLHGQQRAHDGPHHR